MRYIITSTDKVSFGNTPQTITVNVNTNGLIQPVKQPDWLKVEYIVTNETARSLTDGEKNSYVILSFDPIGGNAAAHAIYYEPALYHEITGWYLPARTEFENLLDTISLLPTSPLTHNSYWTSTEDSETTAIGCSSAKLCTSHNKGDLLSVLPIKKITYTDPMPPYSVGEDLGYGYVYKIDSATKTMFVVAKKDLSPVRWGMITLAANANFTTSLNLSVNRNDRYVDLSDPFLINLKEDTFTTSVIIVTQLSSDSDSQSVFLKDIIDNIMIESINGDSYLQGINRFHALLLAKRLIQDLNYDCERELRVYEAEISAANKVIPPIDFVDYVRLSLVTPSGVLVPLFVNKNLNISQKYIKDDTGEIIVDSLGYPIKVQGTRDSAVSHDQKKYWVANPSVDGNFRYDNALYGIKGGQQSYTGAYRYDAQAREFLLDGIPDEFTHVVIEYLSDPIAAEKDPRKLRIHKYFQSPLEAGIYHLYINKLRNVPRIEKESARREYYNEVRKAQRRMFTKPAEMIQKLGSDVGFNKML